MAQYVGVGNVIPQLTERSIIAVGTKKYRQSLYYILPFVWCQLQGVKKGGTMHLVLTDHSIIAFPNKEFAEEFLKVINKEE